MNAKSTRRSSGWAAARLARQVELAVAEVELSVSQYRVLMQLAHDPDAATSLAQKLAVSAPSVSNVVDGLVQRGAIDRSHSLDDRRRITLELTEVGRSLLVRADEAVTARLESIAGSLEDEGAAAELMTSLEMWGDALDKARTKRLARSVPADNR